MSLTGLFNLVSNISQDTRLGSYLARRNEYVDLFGGGLRGRFGACQRGPLGLIFTPEFQEQLMREARRRERNRAEPREDLASRLRRIRRRAVKETAQVAGLASAAALRMTAEIAASLGLASEGPRLAPSPLRAGFPLGAGFLERMSTRAAMIREAFIRESFRSRRSP
jgi:hypothetical protein